MSGLDTRVHGNVGVDDATQQAQRRQPQTCTPEIATSKVRFVLGASEASRGLLGNHSTSASQGSRHPWKAKNSGSSAAASSAPRFFQ
jgi:hypothetical protein